MKQSKSNKSVIVGYDGDPCPRCGKPTLIYEHKQITEKLLRQAQYYSRWFYCSNVNCRTNLITPARYRVEAPVIQPEKKIISTTPSTTPKYVGDRPPWED